jgi:hypothetical protein
MCCALDAAGTLLAESGPLERTTNEVEDIIFERRSLTGASLVLDSFF